MSQLLLIVARDRQDLLEYWTRWFAGVQEVQVVLDRRRGERRQHVQAHAPEQRRADRRRKPGIGDAPRSSGFEIIAGEMADPLGSPEPLHGSPDA